MLKFPSSLTLKDNPNSDDILLIADSADGNKPKSAKVGSIGGGAYGFTAISSVAASYNLLPLTFISVPEVTQDTEFVITNFDNSLAQEYVVAFDYQGGSITFSGPDDYPLFVYAGTTPVFQSGYHYELHIVRGYISWLVYENGLI